MFIDEAELEVRGGAGGAGAVSFRRERYVPRGGPDGGDGGDGGSVFVVADGRLRTLNHFAGVAVANAAKGGDGGRAKKTGKAGKDCVLRVPVGTEVRVAGAAVLGEVLTSGERLEIARGGRAGRGNARFATPVMQTPRFAEKGAAGVTRRVILTLRVIADVALVGPPNAGKSSLLAALTGSRPKIAPYPFTTLAPQLGIVEIPPGAAFAVVEVPGLLEGAAVGRGLGHDFLRHVQRAGVLVVVVDAAGEDAARDAEVVLHELAAYDKRLFPRVGLIAVNKVDLAHPANVVAAVAAAGIPAVATSALTGEGIAELKSEMARLVRGA